ncbi:MAG: LytR/AlgR family response regulator transcription factor [Chitinophagaceae bacterium]
MPTIKCLIVEDEPLAVQVLQDYLLPHKSLELKAVFRDAISATDYLRKEKVDLLFLDIHLPGLKGLDFLRLLPNPPVTILTTAYPQYALDGFELGVADYLLKPVSQKRFQAALNKALRLIQADQNVPYNEPPKEEAIYLNVNRRKTKIPLDDILYIESQREYVLIVSSTREYVSKIGTAELEAMLPNKRFKRIHRSFIVAVAKIDNFSREDVEIAGVRIPIGKNFRDSWKENP